MYSIAMKSKPSASAMSYTVTILAWLREAAALASCRKRCLRSVSTVASGGNTLIATSRASRVSRAL